MDEAGNHHSQPSNIRTEDQTSHVFTCITHWGLTDWVGRGGIALGEISNVEMMG